MKVVFTISSAIYNDSRSTKELFALLKYGLHVKVLGCDRTGEAEQQCKKLFGKYAAQISFDFYHKNLGGGYIKKNSR